MKHSRKSSLERRANKRKAKRKAWRRRQRARAGGWGGKGAATHGVPRGSKARRGSLFT